MTSDLSADEYRVTVDGLPLSVTIRNLDEAMQQAAIYRKYQPVVQRRTVTEWEDVLDESA